MFLISQVISTILQIFVISLIPFVVYFTKFKSTKGFLRYIGVYGTDIKETIHHVILAIIIIFITMIVPAIILFHNGIFNSEYTIQGKLKLQGFNIQSMVWLLLNSIFQTSLSEEILFRGFIGKQLAHKFGFIVGNTIQSIIFGLMHTLIPGIGFVNMIILFIATSVNGYISGYLVEKKSNGSIIPSWICHAFVNSITFFLFAYVF